MMRGEPLGHILLDGPPGLGKTTFATCIPRDLGVSFQIGSGAALAAPKDIIPYLTNAAERSILFIDEAHTMIGAGAQSGQGDAANLLKPALARGELHCIGATTLDVLLVFVEGVLFERFISEERGLRQLYYIVQNRPKE